MPTLLENDSKSCHWQLQLTPTTGISFSCCCSFIICLITLNIIVKPQPILDLTSIYVYTHIYSYTDAYISTIRRQMEIKEGISSLIT